MRTLVVYYSFEGHCEFIAEEIRKSLGADLLRLETADEKKRTGLKKFVWGGLQVLTRLKPTLKPYTVASNAYDLIIIGAPVWAGSPAPALYSFFDRTGMVNKRLALFCCCRGGPGKFFEKLKAILAGNNFAGEMVFVNPEKDSPQTREQIAGWLKTLG